MDKWTMILGVILFAIATMIIYAWGLRKQMSQGSDLMKMLFSKGNGIVKKYLKKNEYITIEKVEELTKDITAKMAFSKNVAVVKNKRDFARQLMEYMVKTGQVEQKGNKYYKTK